MRVIEVDSDGTALRRSVMRVTRRLRREGRPGARASAKLGVLGSSTIRWKQTPRQLAAADRIQPQSLSRTLAALERDGLVDRRRETRDRRSSWIGVTAEGSNTLGDDMADRWLETQLALLSPGEQAILRLAAELIDRLADES